MSKVVVITGASAGVGRATAREFAKHGFSVALLAREPDRLQKAAAELGVKALAIATDVSDAAQVETAAKRIEDELGPISVWVNNAMASVFSEVRQMTVEEFNRVTAVTYLGTVYGTLAALKYMRERNSGVIIQVGSALAFRSIPLQSAYCGAKHGVQGFTESVRCELLHEKSRVKITSVHLPALNTPQFSWVKSRLPRKPQPVAPIFQPEVAARAIVYASKHYRRQWLVTGSTLFVWWGQKLAPIIADWHLARNQDTAQQYNGPDDPERPNNLFQPVKGDFGAHGEFDQKAHSHSFTYLLSRYRLVFWLVGALIALYLIL